MKRLLTWLLPTTAIVASGIYFGTVALNNQAGDPFAYEKEDEFPDFSSATNQDTLTYRLKFEEDSILKLLETDFKALDSLDNSFEDERQFPCDYFPSVKELNQQYRDFFIANSDIPFIKEARIVKQNQAKKFIALEAIPVGEVFYIELELEKAIDRKIIEIFDNETVGNSINIASANSVEGKKKDFTRAWQLTKTTKSIIYRSTPLLPKGILYGN